MANTLATGVVHTIPADMRKMLMAKPKTAAVWNTLTPLARNEWICWTISVKTPKTRAEHIARIPVHLAEGKHRPCCFAGCPHRSK